MKKIIVNCAFGLAFRNQVGFEKKLAGAFGGFSRLEQKGVWVNEEGRLYSEISYQYHIVLADWPDLHFRELADNLQAWFREHTQEESILLEWFNDEGRYNSKFISCGEAGRLLAVPIPLEA